MFIDEIFARIQGKQRYLWRAVDQDGEVVDVLLQERRNATAANLFNLGRHLVAADHYRAMPCRGSG